MWLNIAFKEFLKNSSSKSTYEIVDIYECKKTGYAKAVIKLSPMRAIEKYIHEIVMDNNLIEELDKKTIRTLTYIATTEKMKPVYSVIIQKLTEDVMTTF